MIIVVPTSFVFLVHPQYGLLKRSDLKTQLSILSLDSLELSSPPFVFFECLQLVRALYDRLTINLSKHLNEHVVVSFHVGIMGLKVLSVLKN